MGAWGRFTKEPCGLLEQGLHPEPWGATEGKEKRHMFSVVFRLGKRAGGLLQVPEEGEEGQGPRLGDQGGWKGARRRRSL